MLNYLKIVFTLLMALVSISSSAQFSIVGEDRITCQEDDLILEATTAPGITDYQWYFEGVSAVVLSTSPTFEPSKDQLQPGENNFAVTAKQSGSMVSDTITIFLFPNPSVELGGSRFICEGDSIQLSDQISGGGTFSYQWSTGEITPQIYVDSSATYRLVKTGPGPNPCSASDTVQVTVVPVPELATMSDKTICPGEPALLNASIAKEGQAPYTYNWSPGEFLGDSTVSMPQTTLFSDTVFTVVVQGSSPAACRDTGQVSITVAPKPKVSTSFSDSVICMYDTVSVTASPSGGLMPYAYEWSPANLVNDTTSAMVELFPLDPTKFLVELTDGNGCTDTTSVQIYVNDVQLEISPSSDTVKCNLDTINLAALAIGGSFPYDYRWYTPSDTIDGDEVSAVDSGRYVASAVDAIGCRDTQSISVFWNGVLPPSILEATLPDSIAPEETVGMAVEVEGTAPEVTWSTTGQGQLSSETGDTIAYIAANDEPDELAFTVIASNECGTDQQMYQLLYKRPGYSGNVLFIPNAVVASSSVESENHFRIYGENIASEDFELRIMTRQGVVVYETSNLNEAMNNGWEATDMAGNQLDSGVFTYSLTGKFINGQTFQKVGTVTVIR